MATYTTRNDLKKPDYTDAADIEDLNDNFDFIDGSIAPCEWAKGTAPTVDDDVTFGYIAGSLWLDTTNHKLYICESNGDGAAVWRQFFQSGAAISTPYQITSTLADGTKPLDVTSKTVCTNLNADMVDGIHSSTIIQSGGGVNMTGTLNSTLAIGTPPITVTSTDVCTNLDADLLDGYQATAFAILAGQSKGQTLYGGTAKDESLSLYSNSNGATGYVNIPQANLVIGTKATTAPNFAIAIHEGAAAAANPIYFMDGDGSTVAASIYKDTGNSIIFCAGDGSTADAYIDASNGKFYDNNGIASTYTKTDPGNSSSCIGMTIRPTYTGAESVTETFYGVYDAIFPEIQGGHTNSGTLQAYYTEAMRNHNAAGTDDDGTLTTLAALVANFGHYNGNTSMKGTTTTAMGLYLGPFGLKGTITNLIGIRISTPSTGGTITNQWAIYSDWNAQHYFGGDVYTTGNCSALSFTDRTPGYEGDALAELSKVKNTKEGHIDHDTLPEFARRKVEGKPTTQKVTREIHGITKDEDEPVDHTEESGRDLGAMISILVKAVQQLTEKNEELEARIAQLEKKA